MSKLPYRIKFPIGDWSDDGHGECNWFVVQSNKPVEELRKLHFESKKVFGFDIGDMCGKYEESYLDSKYVQKFIEINLQRFFSDIYKELDDNPENWQYVPEDSLQLLDIWLSCYKHIDESFEYKLEIAENLPAIHLPGADKDKRHLKTPGYGLFY